MANIRPFKAYIPKKGLEAKIAALPYDVYNREEALKVVTKNPQSFLRIDRAETNFSSDVDTYDERVYLKAKQLLKEWIAEGIFVKSSKAAYYIYQQIMDGRPQTGIVGVSSVKDYENNIIKKHENTLAAKEADRIRHIEATNMQTGPIFLAFRSNEQIDAFLLSKTKEEPYFDFVSDDGIGHKVWIIEEDEDILKINDFFKEMQSVYIADGHHRCASACKVGASRRKEGIAQEYDFFLSVLFPENQLKIMDYNRVVKDLNGYNEEEFIEKLTKYFDIEKIKSATKPSKKGQCSMYIGTCWYMLDLKKEYISKDSVEGLDVSILQKYVLDELLGIKDPKNDKRIDFVGGIRGLLELERRCATDCKVAFAMYPTDINELFAVSDEGKLMPPKSTWFEPKLRSGLFLHDIG